MKNIGVIDSYLHILLQHCVILVISRLTFIFFLLPLFFSQPDDTYGLVPSLYLKNQFKENIF